MSAVVGLPQVQIRGLSFSEAEERSLVALRVQQKVMLPSLCELVFSGVAGVLPSNIAQGDKFSIRISESLLFEGKVTALQFVYGASGERELRIRAFDALHKLRLSQMVRAHVDVTVADIAREFSKDFSVNALENSPSWSWILQHNQANFDFLRQAADEAGLLFYMHGTNLNLYRMEGFGAPIDLHLERHILEARIDINNAFAVDGVHTAGWQPTDFAVHRDNNPLMPFAGNARYHVNRVLGNEAQARARSQSEQERREASRKVVWAVVEGDARLYPGVRVRIDGTNEAAQGVYSLTSVTHIVDSTHGFISEIDSQPPAPAQPDTATVATVGEVSRIGGPNGRIKVQLNAFEANQDIETEWLSVVTPGAGADKGFVSLPEVGDTVLVLLMGTFPVQGVVLGGVYGANNPPDDGIDQGKRQRFVWRTRQGQSIALDDAGGILRLMNRDGSVIELAPSMLRIQADTDLEISAPGKTITIRGNAINFEQG